MKTLTIGPWIYYVSDEYKPLSKEKCGKWMYFFENRKFVENICKKAIEEKAIIEAKHSADETGVACFYLNSDDVPGHKKIIEFFLTNNLIRQTKTGKLYNISYKLDKQTRNGEYGEDFKAEIKLDQFVDLITREWKI